MMLVAFSLLCDKIVIFMKTWQNILAFSFFSTILSCNLFLKLKQNGKL